jgi:hypothetical protein
MMKLTRRTLIFIIVVLVSLIGITLWVAYGPSLIQQIRHKTINTSSSSPTPPMEELTLKPCDLDASGQCDSSDLALFQQALGKSRGDPGYNLLADADADGIVTTVDQQILFPATSPGEN